MTPDRLRQIASVLEICLELDSDSRQVYLNQLGAKDPDLQATVESYLESDPSEATPALTELGPRAGGSSPGDHIGPYRIVEWLGAGGMGTVFLAERDDHEYRRQVAVKVLSIAFPSPEVLRRFRSERQILASFDHPNIARMFEGGTTADGRPYLAMEYVDGPPLPVYCDTEALPIQARVELFVRVCSAVRYAHNRLVVHRDLKPSNVLVHSDGEPKLLDFGIAKLLDPDSFPMTVDATQTGAGPLTPRYASPEQLRGEAITTASDVYSLGVLLYLVLTRTLPQSDGQVSPFAAMRYAVIEEPAPPSVAIGRSASTPTKGCVEYFATSRPALRQQLAGDLDSIVLKALRANPDERYSSVEQLSEDLSRHLAGLPVTARGGGLTYRLGRFVRRNKLPVAVAAGFTGMAGTFVAALRSERDAAVSAGIEADVARRRAEDSARAEQESTRFLVDLLGTGELVYGRVEMSVRELVARAAEQLLGNDRGLAPQSYASLLGALGSALVSQGEKELARELLDAALDIRRRELPPDHHDLASTLTVLGRLHSDSAEYDEALCALDEAHRILARTTDHDSPPKAEVLHLIGTVQFRTGALREAEQNYRRALAIRIASLGRCDRAVTVSRASLAASLLRRGDYASGLEAVSPIFECFDPRKVEDDILFAYSLDCLTGLLMEAGYFHIALPLADRAVRVALHSASPDNVIFKYWNLFTCAGWLNRWGIAFAALERMKQIASGEDPCVNSATWLALIHSGQGWIDHRQGDSKRAMMRMHLVDSRTLDSDPDALVSHYCIHGEASLANGLVEEAVASFERAEELRRAHFSARSGVVARLRKGQAAIAEWKKAWRAADELYSAALAAVSTVPAHPLAHEVVASYGGFLRGQGREAEAVAVERQVAAKVATSPPPDLPGWLFEDLPDDDR